VAAAVFVSVILPGFGEGLMSYVFNASTAGMNSVACADKSVAMEGTAGLSQVRSKGTDTINRPARTDVPKSDIKAAFTCHAAPGVLAGGIGSMGRALMARTGFASAFRKKMGSSISASACL
jgi:hypothetical protein